MIRKSFITVLQMLPLLLLTACGGSNSDDNATDGSGGSSTAPTWSAGQFPAENTLKNYCQVPRTGIDPYTRQSYPDRAGTSMHEKMWLRSWTDNTYLWYQEVADRNPAPYSVANYFDLLKSEQLTDSGSLKDNYHYANSTAEYRQQTQAGVAVGYGIRWAFGQNYPPRTLIVAYVEPASPAMLAGIVRGDTVQSINGIDFIYDSTEAGVAVLNQALLWTRAGEQYNFVFLSAAGERKAVSLTAANVETTPVQNVKVIETSAGKVGYMQFNSYIIPAQQPLINAIRQFAAANIRELVIDLRYNGGGLLAMSSQLGYMVTGPALIQDRMFEQMLFNDKHTTFDPVTGNRLAPTPFYSKEINYETGRITSIDLPALNLSRVFVLSTENTCSASEAFINALRGINVEVILIGGQTCGKPYGFYPTDNCGITYSTIQFKGINAKGFGEYADGFIPTNAPIYAADVKGCPLADDFSQALGNTNERLLSSAIYYAQYGRCPELVNAAIAHSPLSVQLNSANQEQARLFDPRAQNHVLNNKIIIDLQPEEEQ